MIRVADYIAQRLIEHKIKDVFMIVGGGAMYLNDAFGNSELNCYFNHHEQACAIAAEGYYRATGRMPVVSITTGPGGTNTITGVLGQWTDSIPALYISGQVSWDTTINSCPDLNLRQLGVQEVDIISIVKPITKYVVSLRDPQETKKVLDEAIYIATHGRPGPVWIDIPLDVQGSMIDPDILEDYIEEELIFGKELLNNQTIVLIEKIKSAKAPVLYIGNGIRLSGSVDLYRKLLNEIKIPVVTAISGHDLITTNDPLFFGCPGSFGDRMGNITVQNSDLIIILGTRMGIWQTTYNFKDFGRNAYKIMVDIDEAELNKPTLNIDLKIHSDLKLFLGILLNNLKSIPDFSQWIDWGNKLKKQLPSTIDDNSSSPEYVNSYVFTERLFNLLSDDAIVVTGNGTAFTGTLQSMKVKEGMRIFCNHGCASMGYDLPAAIGAYIGSKKEIILITGDGSIMMNLQELQTIVAYNLPIKIFILENNGYLAIRTTQTTYFNKRFVGESPQSGVILPSFEKIAQAFGIRYIKIESELNIDLQLSEVLNITGLVICEIKMDPNQTLYPKVRAEKKEDGTFIPHPMEDMFPYLEDINIWFNK